MSFLLILLLLFKFLMVNKDCDINNDSFRFYRILSKDLKIIYVNSLNDDRLSQI